MDCGNPKIMAHHGSRFLPFRKTTSTSSYLIPQAALWVCKHCAFLLRLSIQTDKVFTAVMMVAALGCLFSINRRALWQSEPRLLTRFFSLPLQMLKGQMVQQMDLSGNLMFLKKHGRTSLHRRARSVSAVFQFIIPIQSI